MAETTPPPLPASKEELLTYEVFMAEVLRQRRASDPEKPPKPLWQRFLETTGGTALITVLIGGIAGGIITGLFQYWAKDRETQQAILKTRTEQALLSYREYLDKRQGVDKNAYELLAACVTTSDDHINAFTRDDYNPERYTGKSRQEAISIREGAKKAYEEATSKWRSQRELTGLLLALYHDNNPDVATTWEPVKVSLDDYIKCAESCFLGGVSGCGCRETSKQKLITNLSKFQTAIAKSRDFFWKQSLCSNDPNAFWKQSLCSNDPNAPC